MGKIIEYTPASIEPCSISDLKLQLHYDGGGTFDENLTLTQSLAYGSHAIVSAYTHLGVGVEVIGKEAEVLLHCGTNGATGTVDTKIQESDDNSVWNDWTGGAFTQVTTANDNADYKKQYTGSKRYIRTASKVLLAACEFGTSILTNSAVSAEDSLLTSILMASREHVENITNRKLMSSIHTYYLDEFPANHDYIELPYGNLQSIEFIKYKDSEGTETTLTVDADYLVETNGPLYGRIVLPYGVSWPSAELYPSNPISIRFTSGWTAAANVPYGIKAAILMICTDLYLNREAQVINSKDVDYKENKTVMNLLRNHILYKDDF